MLLLQIPLLAILLRGGDNEDAFQDQIFRAISISYSYNHSWAQTWASGWLGELQTYSWKSNSGGFIFLRPWSKGNFSNKEITEVEEVLQRFYAQCLHILHNHASQWMFEYPFEIQATVGCELHSGEVKLDFWRLAYQGSELLSLQNNTWLPSPEGGTRAQQMCTLINHYTVTKHMMLRILSDTCPRYLLSALDAGKADLQRKVKPEAWLSTGPNPGPNHLLLIFLDVEATKTSGLSCRVRHSSLEGQDIILYMDHPNSKGLIILAVMVPLVLLLTGLAFWLKKRWTHCEPPPTLLPLE
ncbi:T-cell surface glycoprotein CD1a isoform X3 [Desmodus rotundus]|uniref:T-cell surface glycoprotein CD1a isoform X3 n=1 Tax=Desmodus rotundus TaxID=9430 RepID=UPI002380E4EB|nr:T-cell surface glycoprotein CD1a isoform X3 [Desmodus rotundus]